VNAEKTNRFIQNGHGLEHWLGELVCDDMDRRNAAVAALNAMQDVSSEQMLAPGFDYLAFRAETGTELRRVLSLPDFDAAGFIRRLARLMRQAQTLRMRLWKDENSRTDRVLDRVAARLKEPSLTDERKHTLNRRMGKVICSGCGPKNESAKVQQMLMNQHMAAIQVFAELGEHLLSAPDVARSMLRDRHESYQPAQVIEKLGPAAAVFADDLFEILDAADDPAGFTLGRALAAVIRDDAGRVRELLRRLDSDRRAVAGGAAWTLHELGRRAAELAPEAVGRLMAHTGADDPVRHGAVAALGRVGAGDDAVVRRLLAISREPEMWIRGTALSALGDTKHRPEWVVPRLVEAFDDYREQDPDYTYNSAHERVTYALIEFGPAAAPAVPALVERLRNDEGMDRGVVRALGAIGPAATAALPALEKLAGEFGYDDETLNDDVDPLAVAIRAIRGGLA
jgi:hypothetical protein